MRVKLSETEPLIQDRTGSPLSNIEVVLETEITQPDVSAGLKFEVAFTNVGPDTIQIQDPDDAIGIKLLDHQGRWVPLPTKAPSLLINRSLRPGLHHYAPNLLRLEPQQEHRTTIVLNKMRAPGSMSEIDLPAGRYETVVTSLLLAAETALERESAYRVLRSEQISINFGPQKPEPTQR